MVLQLKRDKLFNECKRILPDSYKGALGHAMSILLWIKNKEGYAVAANQLGIASRLFVCHKISKKVGMPTDIYFNPEYKPVNNDTFISEEGCFSYPGETFHIERFKNILATYHDPRYKENKRIELSGLPAVIFQHETDHLDGIDEEALNLK